MKTTMLKHLVRSQSHFSVPKSYSVFPAMQNERFFSTSLNNANESMNQRGSQNVASNRLLVLGGNGFVGSHVCKEALKQGLTVSSLNRSGRPSMHDSWVENVIWHQGDLLSIDSLKRAMDGVTAVISCVGVFGSNEQMYKIHGRANINAVKAAAEQGVKRYVYVSAADFGLVNHLLKGYYEGKRATEAEILNKYPSGGKILRPGFIYGTKQVGRFKLPLGVIGAPLEMVLKHAKALTKIPIIGPFFTPPVNVTSVANVAVRAAVDTDFPSGILDVFDILQHTKHS